MIPILSGLIAGQGNKVNRLRGFTLSATYVLGMALAYAIAGVLAGLSGNLLTSALQTPWVLGAFAAIFVMLAFSMFGFYQIQLPVAWQTSAANTSNRLTKGTLAGVFGMGALSAVIVGPCVAAPLAGALLYVSQSRDVILGGSALFMMAVGMGLPLLVIGASAGALLPKAGAWMQAVKNFFGVLLIAAALWIISPLVSITIQMLCWSALMIISSVYLHAIDPMPAGAGNLRKLGKGLGVIALLLGIALLFGALSGSRDILRPLSKWQIHSGETKVAQSFIPVSSVAQLDGLLEQAGKPVMLDFYADWCVACKEMERLTFQDDSVKKHLANMTLVRADVTANNAADSALLKKFHLYGPPGVIFFDSHGAEIKDARVIGYVSAERFLSILENVASRN
jgi:thiol:disulfide interchange protein DsbD